ncbi:hypothetical protein MP638_002232 [Amoeboaphelidium occidentale]|nr:hypothetical protein MP638_002232 [Amoeboaphelidium occidentale]
MEKLKEKLCAELKQGCGDIEKFLVNTGKQDKAKFLHDVAITFVDSIGDSRRSADEGQGYGEYVQDCRIIGRSFQILLRSKAMIKDFLVLETPCLDHIMSMQLSSSLSNTENRKQKNENENDALIRNYFLQSYNRRSTGDSIMAQWYEGSNATTNDALMQKLELFEKHFFGIYSERYPEVSGNNERAHFLARSVLRLNAYMNDPLVLDPQEHEKFQKYVYILYTYTKVHSITSQGSVSTTFDTAELNLPPKCPENLKVLILYSIELLWLLKTTPLALSIICDKLYRYCKLVTSCSGYLRVKGFEAREPWRLAFFLKVKVILEILFDLLLLDKIDLM